MLNRQQALDKLKDVEADKVELQCRRLMSALDKNRSGILAESLGYLGLADAYVRLSDKYNELRMERQNEQR